ncbi:2-hydroxyacid dehydrogenase [uncultured Mesonia sp.]|uniref:2-hydroxyacid dehydrogenase n=1 Tax=uncultured Mesonia sp. TaxID=399731 RepID=UPI00374E330C
MYKVLHLDRNHPLLIKELKAHGFTNHEDYDSPKQSIQESIAQYDGIIIRSRFSLDKAFLEKAENLKFIGRLGAGLENIDVAYAEKKGIKLFSAPEGNRNAVGEHALGMLLSLFNHLNRVDAQVRQGIWQREANRGIELEGKTVGIIGYGNMGKAFAKKLSGFDCEVIFHDIQSGLSDDFAAEVSLEELQSKAQVLSLHTPLTASTKNMVDAAFIQKFQNSFWLINTARGKSVVTEDLVEALKSGKILGAGLDVLEYEKSSFENFFNEEEQLPESFQYLIQADQVLLSPHIAGWTLESKLKLAQVIANKIKANF